MFKFIPSISQRTFFFLSVIIIFFSLFSKVRIMDKLSIYSDYDEYYTASTLTGYFDPAYIQAKQNGINLTEELSFAAKHATRDSGNSTLYNFVGIVLTRLFDLSERGMRYLSLSFYLFALLILLKIFEVFKTPYLIRTAGVFILCFFSSFSQFSVIIRTYSFSVFLVLFLTYYLFVYRPDNHLKTIIISMLLSVAVFFSHFLTVFPLIIMWLYLVVTTPRPIQSSIIRGVTLGGILCLLVCLTHWEWITHFLEMSHEIGDESATSALKSRSVSFSLDALFNKSLVFYAKYFFGGNAFNLIGLGFFSSILLILFWIWFSFKNRKNHFILLYNIGGLITLLLVIKSQHFLPFGPKYNIFYLGFWIIGLLQISQESNNRLNRTLLILLLLGGLGNAYGNWKGPYPKNIQINLDGHAQTLLPQQSADLKEKTARYASAVDGRLIFKSEEELCLFLMIHGSSAFPLVVDHASPTKLEIPGFPKYYGPY